MLLQDEGSGLGMRAHGRGDLLRDPEAGAPVGEGDHAPSVDGRDDLLRPVVVRERHDGVGMGVDHRLGGEEAVQQRLD